jgi:plastocyanin
MRVVRWLMGTVVAASLVVLPAPGAQAQVAAVHLVVGFTYVPGSGHVPVALDSVKKGRGMFFVNLDPVAHDVTFIGAAIYKVMPTIGSTATVPTRNLLRGHTYKYYCTIHGASLMSGLVKIT